MQILQLGNISLDGSKIHADASKSQAVSNKRMLKLEVRLRREVEELFALAEKAEAVEGFEPQVEITRQQQQWVGLTEAKKVLELRAQARHAQEMAEYEARLAVRAEKAQQTGK
jgi:hypothetical protein